MKVKISCMWAKSLQSCPILCDPIDYYSLPGSALHTGEQNTGVGCLALFQGIFPTQGLNPRLLTSPVLSGGFFTTQFSSVQSLSRVRLFATPWITAHQASLSITNSRSSLKLRSIESVMPSSHLILCRPLLLLSPIPPIIRVFSNESSLRTSITLFI